MPITEDRLTQKNAPMRLDDVLAQEQALPDDSTPETMRLGDVVSMQNVPVQSDEPLFEAPDELRQVWESQGPIGFFEQFDRQDKTEIFFSPETTAKSVRLLVAVNRMKGGDATPEDQQILEDHMLNMEEERIRGFTNRGRIAQGLAFLPSFMIEFWLTGGLATIGRTAVTGTARRALGEAAERGAVKFATRAAGGVAGGLTRVAGQPHRLATGFADRQTNASLTFTDKGVSIAEQAREKPATSFLKSFGDLWIENASEVAGRGIGEVAGRLSRVFIPRQVTNTFIRLFRRLSPGEPIERLFTRAGYNGFLEEMGEERLGNTLRAITGVEDFGADDPSKITDRLVASIPNSDELLVEAGVLAFPVAIATGTGQAVRFIQQRKEEAGVQEPELREPTVQELDDIARPEEQEAEPAPGPEGPEPDVQAQQQLEEALSLTDVNIEQAQEQLQEALPELSEALRLAVGAEPGQELTTEQQGRIAEEIEQFLIGGEVSSPELRETFERTLRPILPAQEPAEPAAEPAEPAPAEPAAFPFGQNIVEEVTAQETPQLSRLRARLEEIEDAKERAQLAREAKIPLDAIAEQARRSIRPFRKGELAEELRALPAIFKSRKGQAIDEVRQELQSSFPEINVETDAELVDFLSNLQYRRKELAEIIRQARVPTVRRRLSTDLKRRVRDIESGIVAGRRFQKKEIRSVQQRVNKLLEESNLEAKDRDKFRRTVQNIQSADQLVDVMPDLLERVERLEDAAERRDMIGQIRKEMKTTKPRKQSGRTIGRFGPEIQKVLDALREAVRMSGAQAAEKLENNLQANDSGNTKIPSGAVALQNVALQIVSNPDAVPTSRIRELLRAVRALKEGGRELMNVKFLRDAIERDEQREIVKAVVDSRPSERIETTGRASADESQWGWYNRLTVNQLGWDTLMNRLSFFDKSSRQERSALNRLASVFDIETKEKRGIRLALRKVRRMQEAAYGKMTGWEREKKFAEDSQVQSLGVFKNARGGKRELTLSRAQARKRWMEFFQPSLQDTIFSDRGMAWTPEMRDAVDRFLSPADKQFARAQLDFYRDYREAFNDVYSEINGIDLGEVPFYSPIRRAVERREALEQELLGEESVRRGITPSAGKARVRNIIKLQDLNDVAILERHIQQVEHYKAWASKVRQLNGIFNDPEVRAAIDKNFGTGILRSVDIFIEDFTRGGIDRSRDNAALNVFKNNYTVFVLGGKVAITAKQLVSFPAFAESIPSKEFVAGLVDFMKAPRRKAKILAASEFMRNRGFGFTPEMQEAIKAKEFKAFQTSPNTRRMFLLLTRLGDRGAIFFGGWSVYRYHKEVLGKSHKEAIREFSMAADATQQSSALSQQNEWQRGNSFQRLFAVFLSAPNQFFRKELQTWEALYSGRIDKRQAMKALAIYHFILPTLFQYVADGYDWRTKEQIRAAALGSLNGFILLGDVLNGALRTALGLKNWPSDTILSSLFEEVTALFREITDEDDAAEKFFDVIKQGIEVAGVSRGLPTAQAVNIIEGMDQISEARNGEEWLKGFKRIAGWSEFVVEQGGSKKTKGIGVF